MPWMHTVWSTVKFTEQSRIPALCSSVSPSTLRKAVDSRIRRGRHGGTGSTGSRAVAVAMGLYSSVHAVYN